MQHIDEYVSAHISPILSASAASGSLYSQHTDLWTHIYSVHHSSICLFLSLFLSLPCGLFVCTPSFPLSLLLPSSPPLLPQISLHKISHLLTQFTEINFPPNPKSHTGVCVCIGCGGRMLISHFQDEFMSVLCQCTTIHGIAGRKHSQRMPIKPILSR